MTELRPVLAAVLAGAIALAVPAAASDLVEMGRATVDGREVVLLKDGTWRLVGPDAPADRCEGAAEVFMRLAPVSLCLDPDGWSPMGELNRHDAVFASTRVRELYLGITVGWGDHDTASLREAILDYALEASGQPSLDMLEDGAVPVDGGDWHRVSFVGPTEMGDFRFWNVFRAGPYANVQLLFWAPVDEAEEASPVVEEVLGTVRMNGW